MGGCRVTLSGSNLAVACPGKTYSTPYTVTQAELAQVEARVQQAITFAATRAATGSQPNADHAAAIQQLNAGTEAGRIRGQLTAVPAAPPREERRETPTPPPVRPRERRTPQAPRPQPPPRRTTAPERVPAAPARPTISTSWIERQLGDGERADGRAANSLHMNREFIDQFFGTPTTPALRTENQNAATVAVFNALYQIPRFRLFLSSQAGSAPTPQMRERFTALQTFLSDPANRGGLTGASPEIMSAAELYMRYYLLDFVAQGNPNYVQELNQLPTTKWRLDRLGEVRALTRGTQEDRNAFLPLYLNGPMDSDTAVAAALYLRRWNLEHPARGRGRSQSDIPVWQAPQVIPLEEHREAPAPQRDYSEALRRPNIGVIGASLMANGRVGRSLQTSLQRSMPESRVTSHGVGGQSTALLKQRFQRDILDRGYNIVVISANARVNEGSGPVETTTRNLDDMITRALSAGKMVIVVGITPWHGHSAWTPTRQNAVDEVNRWLRARTDITFVDISSLGEPSAGPESPLRLRREFDSGDHLHFSDRGSDEVGMLIYQAAFANRIVAPSARPAAPQRSALQQFADQNWATLAADIARAVREGRPEAVITTMRALPQNIVTTLPERQRSFEGALETLGRTDVRNAFDDVFNNYLRGNSEFVAFLRGSSNRELHRLADSMPTLSNTTRADQRTLLTTAAQLFINDKMRTNERLRQDLSILYRQALGGSTDALDTNGRVDMRTLTAIGVYAWRASHANAPAGEWARPIGHAPPPRQGTITW